MKKLRLVTITMLAIFALTLAGNAAAYNATYEHVDWDIQNGVTPVIDGTYGTPATGPDCEWQNSEKTTFGTNGIWRDTWVMAGSGANEYILIETADATNDAGDNWDICFDGGTVATPGDATPQTNDRRVVITGHGGTATTQWYQGTGSGWDTMAAPATANVNIVESLSTSPTISTAHYILEMSITAKDSIGLEATWAVRIAYNDANTGGSGVQMWPPASTNGNPTTWGYVSYQMAANPSPDVPEGFGLIAIVALTAVAVVGSAVFLRKKAVPKLGTKALI